MSVRIRQLIRTAVACVALIAACAVACLVIGPSWHDVRSLVTSPRQAVRDAGADRVVITVAGVLLWTLCGWLALAVACCVLGAHPGRGGRLARRFGRLISPRLLRRACGVAVGVGLLQVVSQSMSSAPAAYAAVTQVPPDDAATVDAAGVDWPVQPDVSSTYLTVTVRPGDCLWSLAQAHLGYDATTAQISAEVDRWWEANANVIGADPDLLMPGQILTIPTG